MLQFANLINGKVSTKGESFEVFSPVDQKILGEGYSLTIEDLHNIFEKSTLNKENKFTFKQFEALAIYIEKHKEQFSRQLVLDTGYILKDAEEIVDGSVELIRFFEKYLQDTKVKIPESKFSYLYKVSRELKITSAPYGVIAAMTPQNGPLILELSVLLNVLAAGNSIILRPSSQCVGTISLLISAFVNTFSQELLEKISIVSCKATDFLSISYKKADLLHYIGSSRHGKNILSDSLLHNIKSLVDGEGTSTVIVDKTASIKEVVEACLDGMIRCNGELCSSIRTIIVHEEKYEEFIELLKERFKSIKVGDPLSESTNMGPLFNAKQVEQLRVVAKKYELLSGELSQNPLGENYITPLLCKLSKKDKSFLQEEIFGPITGVASYKGDEWKEWLIESVYKLNDAVFSNDEKFINEFIATSQSPRMVVNQDPSIESVFEPWGAFLPSGSNDVSYWYDKYRRYYQVVVDLK